MATATPHLFNSSDYSVIAELLYRRTGLLVQPGQMTYVLTALPGTETATNAFVGYGDGATLSFLPKIGNVRVASGLALTALRQTLNGSTTTLDPSTYSINTSNQSVAFTVPPVQHALLQGDFTGVPQPYLTLTAVTSLADLSTGPFVGSVRLELDRIDVSVQIPAILVYSDAFPPTADALLTYLSTHFGLSVTDGEFFMTSDPSHIPIVRGGGLINGTLDGNRQFKLEVANSSIRWSPGSQIVLQQQSAQSIVPPGLFALVGTPPNASLGEPYNYTFQTVNGTAPITFSVISGTPPCPVNAATGAMHADALNTLATYSWVIQATDAAGHVTTKNCIMKVEVTALTVFPDTTTPNWSVGILQTLNFNPYGGQRPFTYAVTSGTMPTGLAIVGDGLQGTMEGNPSPSTTSLQNTFTITATDNQGQKAIMNFNATINDRSASNITASLCAKVMNWWDSQHSVDGSSGTAVVPLGTVLHDGTKRMDLTVGGAAIPITSTGRAGAYYALNFNGVSYAQALSTAYNLPDNFTIVSMLNFPSNTQVVQGQVIFGRDGDAVNGGYSVLVGQNNNTLRLYSTINGTQVATLFNSTFPQGVGNWTLAMIERYNGVPSIILNGGTTENGVPYTGPMTANNTHFFTLGANPELIASSFFGGQGNMFSVFNDKLWSDERKWLWNNGAGRAFFEMGFWPILTIAFPDPSLTWTVDNPANLSLAVAGGTGTYWGVGVVPGNPLPPGMAISFDSVGNNIVISGSPTTLGTYTIYIQIFSTDGQHRAASFPVTVDTGIVPLVNLPMSGTNGATSVTDSTGRVWAVNGAASVSTAVDTNGAMYFPASGTGWLSTPLTHDMDLVNMSFTTTLDVYPTVNAGGTMIYSESGAAASVPLVMTMLWDGSRLQSNLGWIDINGNAVTPLMAAPYKFTLNAWNTFKGVYVASTNTWTLFLNGQAIQSNIYPGKMHPVVNTSDSLMLGGNGYVSNQVNNPFQGYLRNFKWWQGLVYDALALESASFGPYTPNVSGSYSTPIVGGNGTYTVTGASLPAGLNASLFNGNTVQVAGTTTVAHGTYGANITLTSGDGQNVVVPITVDVGYGDLAITPTTLPAAQVGQSYSVAITISGGNGTYTASLYGGTVYPNGLTGVLSGSTYTISGTPTSISSSQLQIQFTSGDGQSLVLTQTFQVAGNFTIFNAATFFSNATTGTLSTDALTVTGSTSTPLQSYVSASALETAFKSTGKWYFEVTDSLGNSALNLLSIQVLMQNVYNSAKANSGGTLVNTYASNQSLAARSDGGLQANGGTYYPSGGINFNTAGTVIGVAVDAATHSIWLRSGSGWLSGNPAAGTSPSSVDSNLTQALLPTMYIAIYGATAQPTPMGLTYNFGQNAFSYSVPLGFFPGWTNSVSNAVTYPTLAASGSLAGGKVGQAYNQTLTCTGGSGIYAANVTSGTLPNGLTATFSQALVGGVPVGTFTINGTPATGATTQTFTVTFWSTDGQSVAQAYTLSLASIQTTWSNTLLTSNMAVTSDGLTAYGTAGNNLGVGASGAVLVNNARATGKWYAEFVNPSYFSPWQYNTAGLHRGTSIAALQGTNTGLGADVNGWATAISGNSSVNRGTFYNNVQSNTITVAGLVLNSLYKVAVDLGAGKIWLGLPGQTGWAGGGSPAAGTLPTYTFTPDGADYYLACNPSAGVASGGPAGCNAIAFVQPANWSAEAPAGFNIWSSDPKLQITGAIVSPIYGQAYSQTLTITGGSGVYSNLVLGGNFQTYGLTATLTGTSIFISGTPIGSGTINFVMTVSSSDGQSATTTQPVPIVGTTAFQTAVLALAPGYWLQCNDASGSLLDSSGAGGTATVVTGTPLYQQPSIRYGNGKSIYLDGTQQFATAGLYGPYPKSGYMHAWFKSDFNATYQPTGSVEAAGVATLFVGGGGDGIAFWIWAQYMTASNSLQLTFQYKTGNSTWSVFTVPAATLFIDPTVSHQIVVQWSNSQQSIYIDGLLLASLNVTRGSDSHSYTIEGISQANYTGSTGYPGWKGWMQDVVVGSGNLTASQIANLYLAGGGSSSKNSYSATVLTSAPVGYWPANETSGLVMNDLSGNGYNATYTSSTNVLVGGGPALRAGAGRSLSITIATVGATLSSLPTALKPATTMSMEAIVYRNTRSGSGIGAILTSFSSAVNGTGVFLNGSTLGIPQGSLVSLSTTGAAIADVIGRDGEPYHVVMTRDTDNLQRFYINGTLVTTATSTYTGTNSWGTALEFLGDNAYPSTYGFVGSASDFAIYNRALSAAEVQQHYLSAQLSNLTVTWSPSNHSTAITLSGITATYTNAGLLWVCAASYYKPGKRYFEVQPNVVTGGVQIGVAKSTNDATLNGFFPGTSSSGGIGYEGITGKIYVNGAVVTTYATYTANDVIGVATDGAGSVWFSKNGVWNGDPVAGTSPAATGLAIDQMPACAFYNHSGNAIGGFKVQDLHYAVPSGYLAYDDISSSMSTAQSIYSKLVMWAEWDPLTSTVKDKHLYQIQLTPSSIADSGSSLGSGLTHAATFTASPASSVTTNSAMLQFATGVTAMAWISPSVTTGNGTYPKIAWQHSGDDYHGYCNYSMAMIGPGGTPPAGTVIGAAGFASTTAAGSNIGTYASTALAVGTAYCLIGTNNLTNLSFYVNGTLTNSTAFGQTSMRQYPNVPFTIGYGGNSPQDQLNANILPVAIFNQALTQAEITYLYNGGTGIGYAALKTASGN